MYNNTWLTSLIAITPGPFPQTRARHPRRSPPTPSPYSHTRPSRHAGRQRATSVPYSGQVSSLSTTTNDTTCHLYTGPDSTVMGDTASLKYNNEMSNLIYRVATDYNNNVIVIIFLLLLFYNNNNYYYYY